MKNFKIIGFGISVSLAIASFGIVGCSADVSDAQTADDDEVSADGALSTAGQNLIGAYVGSGASFSSLVLSVNGTTGKFFADVDNGLRCIRAPCPSSARVTGTFTATKKTLTLKLDAPFASDVIVSKYAGRYSYTETTDKLTLKKSDVSTTLTKADSYCSKPVDCHSNSLMHPMCVGDWSCNQNRCGYHCGMIPAPQ